jgi:hypothetical protein
MSNRFAEWSFIIIVNTIGGSMCVYWLIYNACYLLTCSDSDEIVKCFFNNNGVMECDYITMPNDSCMDMAHQYEYQQNLMCRQIIETNHYHYYKPNLDDSFGVRITRGIFVISTVITLISIVIGVAGARREYRRLSWTNIPCCPTQNVHVQIQSEED